jgi:two-component sensor histidine kinase
LKVLNKKLLIKIVKGVNIMELEDNYSNFDDYIDYNTTAKVFKTARILALIIFLVSTLVFVLNFIHPAPNTILGMISSITDQSLFYMIISFTVLLYSTDYNEKLKPLIYFLNGIVIFICVLALLSFLGLFNINSWMKIYCESYIFGVYNMLSYGFLLYALVHKKYIKETQLLALLNIVIGFGGLLFYSSSFSLNFPHIFHYIFFHIVLTIVFLIFYPTEGLLKSLVLKTSVSHLSRKVIVFIMGFVFILCFAVIYLNSSFNITRPAVYVSVGTIAFIILLLLFYSNKLSSIDIQREISEENALKLQENMSEIQDLSKVAIVNYDDDGYNWTSEIFTILDIPNPKANINEDILLEHSVPEYKDKLADYFNNLNPNFVNNPFITKVETGKGDIKYLKIFAKYNINGSSSSKYVGFIQDVTEIVTMQNELKVAFENQSILLKEVHHRVKNNLQIILSLLNLEDRFNHGDYSNVIKQTKTNISSMALIHEQVYQSSDVAHVDANDYFKQSFENLFKLYGSENIHLNLDIDHVNLRMDKSIPLSLIMNELALNTIKYAFPNGEEGNFNVVLKEIDGFVNIDVFDDGVGVGDDFDMSNSGSLGFNIITNLIVQLDADLSLLRDIDGFGVKIQFKNL